MKDNSAHGTSAWAAYWSDEVIICISNELAAKHACPVHVGLFVSDDTGEISPAFLLRPRGKK